MNEKARKLAIDKFDMTRGREKKLMRILEATKGQRSDA